MKFGKKNPKVLSKRIVTKFLIFPKSINGEWKWLEKASYEQLYTPEGWECIEWVVITPNSNYSISPINSLYEEYDEARSKFESYVYKAHKNIDNPVLFEKYQNKSLQYKEKISSLRLEIMRLLIELKQ